MTHPTPESLRAKVKQAADRGPVGPDLGTMTYPERDEALFGTRTTDMRDLVEEMRDAASRALDAHCYVIEDQNATLVAAQACLAVVEKRIEELTELVRETAECLSIEAQISAPTISEEGRLRAKMGHCASDLFAALPSVVLKGNSNG